MFGLDRVDERVGSALPSLVGMADRLDQRSGTMSHGMKKRFSIARSLLHDPSVLLMDEPDSGLDQEALSLLDALITDRSSARRTVIMATHNLDRAISLGDRVAILSNGRVVYHESALGCGRAVGARGVLAAHGRRPVRGYLGPVLAILAKDMLLERRTKDILVSMLVFGLLVIVVFNFAIDPTPTMVAMVAPGILWVAITFGGVLGLNRSFGVEKERGNMHGLMLAPVGRDAIYFGKFLGNFVFMVVVEAIIYPVFAVMFNFSLAIPGLIPVALLATAAIAAVGTVFSAMAVNTRSREVMLPILFLPVVVPVIIGAVSATGALIGPDDSESLARWIPFLAAFDAVFLVVCPVAFSFIMEE